MKLWDSLNSVLNYCERLSDTAFLCHGKGTTTNAILGHAAISRIEFVISTHCIGAQDAADLIALAGDLSMEGISVDVMMDRLNSMGRVGRSR